MRDKRFMAEHRGGTLTKEQHRHLMAWACVCVGHILPLLAGKPDERIENALKVAKAWQEGEFTTGDARKASVNMIALARESSNPITTAVARCVGHAVATAHMADHAMGAVLYALKAVKFAGGSAVAEREWQNRQLPGEIREMVLSARPEKEKHFKI